MRIVFTIILSLVATLHSFAAAETQAYSVETVPNVRLTDTRLHVSDPAALLSTQACDTINAMFTLLEKTTSIEVAVAVLPSIGEADAFEFAHNLFRHWGVGKKGSDNGLVILYVEDQHAIRFVTGYGIEGTMTDALCKRIQTQYMVPAFKNGDRNGGMVAGCKAVCHILDGTMKPEKEESPSPTLFIALLFIAVVILTLYMTGAINVHRRCSHCGKRALKVRAVSHYTLGSRRYRKEILVCEKCGHVEENDIDETNDNDNGGATSSLLSGMFIGSMFGGGRGGGFSGGSFGGGNSGGGGAGSNW